MISRLIQKIESFDFDVAAIQALEETKAIIADLNEQQLDSGIRADDSEITPFYASRTVAIKIKKGQPVDRVTLKDTGSFYRGINIRVGATTVITDSTDEKSEQLQAKYGADIFGLTPEHKAEYISEALRPALIDKIKTGVGL